MQILLIIKDKENGLNKIEYPNGEVLNCEGKNEVGIDYVIESRVEYKFKVTSNNGYEKEIVICEEYVDVFGKIEEDGKTVNDLSEYGMTVSRSGGNEYKGHNELYNMGMGSGSGIHRNKFVLTIDYETLISKLGNVQFKGIYSRFYQIAQTTNSGYTSWINSQIIVTYDDNTKNETFKHEISAKNARKDEEYSATVIFEENKKISTIEMIIEMYDSDYGSVLGYIKNIELIK